MPGNDRLTLMAVFAHPDDETFGTGERWPAMGPTPACGCAGVCDPGRSRRDQRSQLATPERLGEVREQELRCACQKLGVDDVFFLDYRDSGMAGTPENRHPRALAMADEGEAVGKIVAYIRRERPEVVVTFDENGGYGHPDHMAIHRFTKSAFAAAADPAMYPEQLQAGLLPHRAQKLYYHRHSPPLLPGSGRQTGRAGHRDS